MRRVGNHPWTDVVVPWVEGSLRVDPPVVEPAPLADVRGDWIRPFSRVVDADDEGTNAGRQQGGRPVVEFLRQEAPFEFERMRSVGRLPATG